MADTGKQSPLGAGVNGSLLQNVGLCLNPVTVGYVGTSHDVSSYSPGSIVGNSCLKWITQAINAGYSQGTNMGSSTYGNLISVGSSSVPALGNSKAPTYTWIGPANAGDPTDAAAQAKAWYPYAATATTNTYPTSNPTPRQYSNLTSTDYDPDITQWGWIRCFALQAWNEFNWNGDPAATKVYYKDFLSSFNTIAGYIDYANVSINAQADAATFLKNTYSNVDDLMTSDITGISKATTVFGQDLIKTGKVIDLNRIATFGMPSNLLATIKRYNAVTDSLTYAILALGIDISTLDSLFNGATPTKLQEQQLYGAFTIITGADLANILVPLNCGTSGITTLADLLNPMKLFPNSYSTLTVPIYNSGPGPTNAKTYYLIYNNDGINTQLTSPAVISAVGIIGTPPISDSAANTNGIIQSLPAGFGAYLQDILPDDIATACGAFNVAVRQVNNVQHIPIEKFAQIVANLETTKGLPLTAGTNVPTNVGLAQGGLTQTALGSGINGSWVMSDFLGCMSGLPYAWGDIQNAVFGIQTTKLRNIYQELYLAASWKAATVTVQYHSYDVLGTTYYHVDGVTLTGEGAGYGRGGAALPLITINGGSGATAVATSMGTDVDDFSTYGKVLTISLTSAGIDVTTIPTITIECPPTATLPIQSNGSKSTTGVNSVAGTVGWPATMDAVVDAYVTQANTEISSIQSNNTATCDTLNRNWNVTGTQLTIEQHGRDIALVAVPYPRDNRLNPFPFATHAFIDAVTVYAKRTEPHMYAQTIDAISDTTSPGGQSLIAQQRSERNRSRLLEGGIITDDNMGGIQGQPNPLTSRILMGNGTVSTALPNQGIPAGSATFTNPANQEVVGALAQGYFDPVENSYIVSPMVPSTVLGSIPITAVIGQDLAGPNIRQVPNPILPIAGRSEEHTSELQSH